MGKKSLADLMALRGLSKADLARALSVTPPTAAAWAERTNPPDPKKRLAIAEYFGVSVLDIQWEDTAEDMLEKAAQLRAQAELVSAQAVLDAAKQNSVIHLGDGHQSGPNAQMKIDKRRVSPGRGKKA